jgi:alkanesulfonate monooxygenase SsuD/methylene tetrahydromethanopterin reductase-like flavin-dependent oxidoreductase (luciferase family)
VTRVRLGVTLPQFSDDPDVMVAAARRAEAAGLDSVWVFDHLWPLGGSKSRPILECWTSLAWLGAATERVGIGTLVTRSTLRHPAVLAKMAATVAAIGPGRLTVGVGSGDEGSRAENEAFGAPYHSGANRVAQLEDTLEVLRRHRNSAGVTYSGPHARVAGLPAAPQPVPGPALWAAGRSQAVIRLAGRLADGWNGWGVRPEAFAAAVRTLREAAAGRTLEASWGGLAILARTDTEARSRLAGRSRTEHYVAGGPETLAGRLSELVAAGARHLVLTLADPADPGAFELLAERLRPLLASGAS